MLYKKIQLNESTTANNGPWKSLAKRTGAIVKFWKPRNLNDKNPYSIGLDTQDLIPLITSKTRLVAITACSNILGQILPVKKIIQAIRTTAKEKGSLLVEISLDCVAYAPHAQMDVQDWDVDFAVFSYYKVYGPHISGMYVRKSALEGSVKSVVHHFLSPSVDTNGYKLQPNGPGYELTWGTTAIVPYIESLTSTGTLKAGYHAIQAHDAEIAEAMLAYLTADKQRARGVRVVGSEEPTLERMPTVSFLIVDGANGEPSVKSKALINRFDKRGEVCLDYVRISAMRLMNSRSVSDTAISMPTVWLKVSNQIWIWLMELFERHSCTTTRWKTLQGSSQLWMIFFIKSN